MQNSTYNIVRSQYPNGPPPRVGNAMAATSNIMADPKKKKNSISLVVLGFFLVSIVNFGMSAAFLGRTDRKGSAFGWNLPSTTNGNANGFWQQTASVRVTAPGVGFNDAYFSLAWGPLVMSGIYALVYITSDGKKGVGYVWAHHTRSGFDMLHSLWAIFAEGPLFAYLLLVLGEDRVEMVIAVWLLVVYTGGIPSMVSSVRESYAGKMGRDGKAETAANVMALVPLLTAVCTYIFSILLIEIMFINLVTGDRWHGGVNTDPVTTSINRIALFYSSFWTAYRIFAIGVAIFAGLETTLFDPNGAADPDRAPGKRSKVAVVMHGVNWAIYSVVLIFVATSNLSV